MDFWKFLKEKCEDCYNLNKDTTPNGVPFFKNDPKNRQILIPKYCNYHQKEIEALYQLTQGEDLFCPSCNDIGIFSPDKRLMCANDDCRVGSFFTA